MVQDAGVLRYTYRIVSENAKKICKYTPCVIFYLNNFLGQQPVPMLNATFKLLKDLKTILDRLRAHVVRKHLSFVVNEDADVPLLLRGDLPRFQDVVTNLISNAIQYTAEGSIAIHIGA
ncbi:hypothetical protein COCVIDRAFT_31694 [Bipolaris victoriae FI3]|uniref:Histidine kinase domain-containing protein n=1 Tax=Bipolaris victoriae (strain FI3) TaxID=930091 RepID=W7E4Z0_BIPV3|nr:hypothetical protein COCVIDRAFT_31694 [Bipolaris victoriae FI3]